MRTARADQVEERKQREMDARMAALAEKGDATLQKTILRWGQQQAGQVQCSE